MALGSTQPITEIVPGIFPEGKGCWCVGLKNLPHSCADYLEIWEPKLLEQSGSVHGLLELYLITLYCLYLLHCASIVVFTFCFIYYCILLCYIIIYNILYYFILFYIIYLLYLHFLARLRWSSG